jgi:hypothetical protein
MFAAEQLQGKTKGFYSMEDLLLPFFNLKDEGADASKSNKGPWWRFWRE